MLAGLLGQEVPVWRVSEDDPDSGLYAESRDVGAVISYTATHVLRRPLSAGVAP